MASGGSRSIDAGSFAVPGSSSAAAGPPSRTASRQTWRRFGDTASARPFAKAIRIDEDRLRGLVAPLLKV